MAPLPVRPDADLLQLARGGDREAFGVLVSRHQNLVASLAYSICGDFGRSEDLAQEAFVAAWRQLGQLHEAEKFRSWIAGIVRNLALNFVRRRARRADWTPASRVDSAAEAAVADAPDPHRAAVTAEESAVVWSALERLPDKYREPLVLFYREEQSIARVAAALELSEDAVKQRLSRGRELLRGEVERVIARSLGFTTPGTQFTLGVLGALPGIVAPMVASSVTAAAVKGGTVAKGVLTAASISGFAGAGFAFLTAWWSRRETMAMAQSKEERAFLSRYMWWIGGTLVAGNLALAGFVMARQAGYLRDPRSFSRGLVILVVVQCVVTLAILLRGSRRYLEFVRHAEHPAPRTGWRRYTWRGPRQRWNYRSTATLFGWPLVHIEFGAPGEDPLVRGRARGWIAIGDYATAGIFAAGGVAIAPFATGGLAIGFVACGGIGIGVLGLGGIGLGWYAIGGMAFGMWALGGMAFGWEAAEGAIAMAKHFALGPIAVADHANDDVARGWLKSQRFLGVNRPWLPPVAILLNPVVSLAAVGFLARKKRP